MEYQLYLVKNKRYSSYTFVYTYTGYPAISGVCNSMKVYTI